MGYPDFDRQNMESNFRKLSVWIDNHNSNKSSYTQLWERVGKVGEEFGECIGALIGFAGQNPRKGVTHNLQDIEDELLDVAVTALGAVEHIRGNNGTSVNALKVHLEELIKRAGVA